MSIENKTLSLIELSRAICRGENTVRRYVEQGMPYVEKGDRGRPWAFILGECEKWLKDREKARAGVDPELQKQRARLTRINADRRELQLKQERGQLIRTEVARSLWGATLQGMVSKLEALPSRLAPMCFGMSIPEIKAALDRGIYEIRAEMANPDLKEIAKNMKKNKLLGGKRK